MNNRYLLAAVLFTLVGTSPSSAIFVDLVPVGDQWIRSSSGGTVFTSDAMSVRGDAGDTRVSILQFDLSNTGYAGAELLGASLALTARSATTDAGQVASLIDITTGTQGIDEITWDQYHVEHASEELPLSTLGAIAPGTSFVAGAKATTTADTSDLNAISATMDGAAGSLLTFVLKPATLDTNVDWTDGPGQLDNVPSVLRLEFPGVTPPCYTCDVVLDDAVWLRTGQAVHNDGLLVTNNPESVAGAPTVGLLQWNLSNISTAPDKLNGAQLVFTVAGESRTAEPGQAAALIDTTGGTALANIAGSGEFLAEYGGTEQLLEGLGVVPDTSPALLEGEEFVTVATQADLELIRAVLNGSDLLTMALFGSDYASPDGVTGQYWGDGMGYGVAPRLVLTFVPEPSSFTLAGVALSLSLLAYKR